MYRLREGYLKISGMHREVLMCHGGHHLTLLEGMPVEKHGFRCECALNANAANSAMIQRWRNRDLPRVKRMESHIDSEQFSTQESANTLMLQMWGLQMLGASGSNGAEFRPV